MSHVTSPRPVDILDRARAGARLDADDAEILLAARGEALDELLSIASALRDEGLVAAGRAGIVTYSRKVFIPLTTLCRDRCHYCTFVDTPSQLRHLGKPAYMSREQVLSIARQGQALGCKEALFTLGDRPEDRWPEARAWLEEHGFASTLDYVAAMARAVLEETGLLPHLNPGVMTLDEISRLRSVAPSMGMMLETTSMRLWEERGEVHYGSPDKDPRVRLQVIEDAGIARVPFTTGILVGIGETLRDRAESLVAIRDAHERHGHVQETIVQNFRAKPRTAMRDAPDAELEEYVAAVATARLVLGASARIQVPPNLSDPLEFGLLLRAGADDWGGVSPLTADHVNPERPWPQLDELADLTARSGFELRERLTAHPEYVANAETWLDARMRTPTLALADPSTFLARNIRPQGTAPTGDRAIAVHTDPVRAALRRAETDPSGLSDADYEALLHATGPDLDTLARLADDLRRYTVGEPVTMAANRNLASDQYGESFGPEDLEAIALDALDLGLTEICVQGRIPDDRDPLGYLEIARGLAAAAPSIHLHAMRPQDIDDLAVRGGLGLEGALAAMREAGISTVPGTGVKILSEAIRAEVAPGDLHTDRWEQVMRAAHAAGFRSTSVMFYGHVESGAQRIAHLRRLQTIQRDTGGFTEFVPIPLPAYTSQLIPGRSPVDEHRAVVAVSRLLLNPDIRHVQVPWTRHGREVSTVLLTAGGDDLGGTLTDARVKPQSAAEYGNTLSLAEGESIATSLMRPFRRRTTTYQGVS